jgi:hypothetical protein
MVRNSQLPERQQKSLSRLPDLYTAASVPNSAKLDEKMGIHELLRKTMSASRLLLQASVQADLYSDWRLKLVPFVPSTGD